MSIASSSIRKATIQLLIVGFVFVTALTYGTPANAKRSSKGCGRDCKIAVANSYLDAVVSHDASKVPFAENARRIEQGVPTGDGGEWLRKDLTEGDRFKVINGIRDKHFVVEGQDVVVFYLLDTGKFEGGQLLTSQIGERFRIVNRKIVEIEVVIGFTPGYQAKRWWR